MELGAITWQTWHIFAEVFGQVKGNNSMELNYPHGINGFHTAVVMLKPDTADPCFQQSEILKMKNEVLNWGQW